MFSVCEWFLDCILTLYSPKDRIAPTTIGCKLLKRKKVIILEINRIFNEDCLKGAKKIPDNSVDLIITDPPYGVGFSKGFNDETDFVKSQLSLWVDEMYRILKEGCHCYVFIPTKQAGMFITAFEEKFNLMNILSTRTYTSSTYLKNNFSFNNQLVLYLSKGQAKRLNKVDFVPTSESWLKDKRNKNPHPFTYQYPAFLPLFSNEKTTAKSNACTGRHPCAKSVPFEEILIQLSSDEGDVVCDMFMGGGTTALAAINTNRKYIGFELNKEVYDRCIERIEETTAKYRQEEMAIAC